jgi:phage/plasmid primase-like uncharacterized protein
MLQFSHINKRKETIMQITKTYNANSRMLADVLEQTNGQFCSVTFIKKDGTERVLTGRMGVTKHLRGGTKTVPEDKYVTIYDTVNEGYRSVNRDTIKALRANGVEYKLVA